MKKTSVRNLERQLLKEISADEAWKHVEYFSRMDRASGTEGERIAVDYIKKTVQSYGVECKVHEFDAYLSFPGKAELKILSPENRELRTITQAFAGQTPGEGIEGEVVFVGEGKESDFEPSKIRGKITLVEPRGGPDRNRLIRFAQAGGALVQVLISSEDVLHEGIASPVWGTPTFESSRYIPKIPGVSISKTDGRYLKTLCEKGPVRIRIKASPWRGWKKVQLPVATIWAPGKEKEHLLVGGHLDSWYLGATDNATGNAACIELARVFSKHKSKLRRSIKFGWWPGHSTGRYAGSTWYADNSAQDLYENCFAYMNLDSPGSKDATMYTEMTCSEELEDFTKRVVNDITGQEAECGRPGRAGDQSFWGLGVPSLYMLLSMMPHEKRAEVGGSGGGWWWHTKDDTLDKADKHILYNDLKLYTASVVRLCTDPLLPFDFPAMLDKTRKYLANLEKKSLNRFSAKGILKTLDRLRREVRALDRKNKRLLLLRNKARSRAAISRLDQALSEANRCMIKIDKILIPLLYTASGTFDHDPAVPAPPIPSLQKAILLGTLPENSDDFRFTQTELLRQTNKTISSIHKCTQVIKQSLDNIEKIL